MPRLFHSLSSPYSAKVRIAATYAGISFESILTDTNADPADLIAANPLGKIPVWVTDEGTAVHDSAVITQYLNRLTKNVLFPSNPAKRLEAERLESLADGLCDCLLAQVYEVRFRPEDKIYQPWLDRQWSKAERALDYLNANPPGLPKKITIGQIAVRAALGYLALRFPGRWEKGRARLVRWARRFDEKFPELAPHLPK